MLLTTSSSTPFICWLAKGGNSKICKLASFRLIGLSLYMVFPFDFYYFVLHQIFCVQRMQLTIDSSAPSLSWLELQWDDWVCEVKSFWLICICVCIWFFQWIWITLSHIRSYAFKGCTWRPIPAHPRCADWHKGGIVGFVSSRAFYWYAELYTRFSIKISSGGITTGNLRREESFYDRLLVSIEHRRRPQNELKNQAS